MKVGKLIWGIIFILLGFALILSNFDLFEWNKVLIQLLILAIGLAFFIVGINKNKLLESLIGSLLLVSSTVRIANIINLTTFTWQDLWPLSLILIGISCIIIFLRGMKRFALASGVIVLLFGILFFLSTMGFLSYTAGELLLRGWPILLIALGIYSLMK